MAVLDQIPVDRITAEAREVQFGRVLLTVIAAFFYALGWISAKTSSLVWLALAWSAVAVKVGWQDARRADGGRTRGDSR